MSAAPVGKVLAVEPLARPPDAVVVVPGSKSLTNRALVCAALARGASTLRGALFAEDTWAMLEALRALGAEVVTDEAAAEMTVVGNGPSRRAAELDARQSGTTGRFVLPVAALGGFPVLVDGHPQLRARPFAPLLAALDRLGAQVEELGAPGHLPVRVTGPLEGGPVDLPGDISSQFLSGLLLAGPCTSKGLSVRLTSPLVSASYVEMTRRVMADFGTASEELAVPAGTYRPVDYAIEPDASAASYFFAAAAITGGRVTVEGLGRGSLQGDLAFVDVLEQMGAEVTREEDRTTVRGTGRLRGVEVDMSDCSDTAPTLAAVAAFAGSPTRIRGIGFIRRKESDRVAAPVAELRRAGVGAEEEPDGFTVTPGRPRRTRLHTYGDHRLAMSLALLGLVGEGMEIEDPACVAKTFPDYFARLAALG